MIASFADNALLEIAQRIIVALIKRGKESLIEVRELFFNLFCHPTRIAEAEIGRDCSDQQDRESYNCKGDGRQRAVDVTLACRINRRPSQ